jgi:hypothetical protein
MRTRNFALTAVLVAILAGGAGALGAADPGGPEGLCPYLEVSAVENARFFDAGGFSASATSDVLVHIVFPEEFTQEHVVALLFLTPAGHLYRQIDVPVAPTLEGRAAATRRLAGYPYPVRVRVPEPAQVRSAAVASVQVPFPVGGTAIETSSLYGAWMVKVLVDGRPTRCVQPLVFEIVE